MIRTLTLSLLAALLFTAGCKKEEAEADRFVINGLHDVNFNTSATSNYLPIQVMQKNGAQETVNISVENLPDGFWAAIEPNSGTPTFGAMITIHQSGRGPGGGSHPFKVVARSASYTKSYDLNLVLPKNAFKIDISSDTVNISENAYLPIRVEQTSGSIPEKAAVSVTNVPAAITLVMENANGQASTVPTATFHENSILAAGNYPITITATAPSGTATKKMILHAGPWNGYVIDGKPHRVVENNVSPLDFYNVTDHETAFTIRFRGSTPSTNGTHTIPASSLDVTYYDEQRRSYSSQDAANTGTATVIVSNYWYHVKVDNLKVKDNGTGLEKTISIEAGKK